ncbi:MAG TPA: peptidoglycan editing factor PgeF [Steroidobacteraceae bacterium]|nr:peptidoglycan editing factor PgeF [Steroidobacteraceae bacterium]
MAVAAFIEPDWPVPPGVRALVSTRAAGDFAAAAPLPPQLPGKPGWLRQVHGVHVADLDLRPEGEPEADASVTRRRGTVCVVRTADCLPVLFAASDATAVAAAHAGWRGLAAGVLENTVSALRARIAPGTEVTAWLGPAIGPARFEVGGEVREAFLARDAGCGAAFTAGAPGRWMCDLYVLARRRLAAVGVGQVSGGGLCTYADEARFHSHRRDVQHRGLDATGRMASFVWLVA